MFHNYFEDYGYDNCTSRGVCTISPRMASIQEIILLYLREFAGYTLKLKQFNIDDENIKSLILNTLSAFVSNPEISDNTFSNVICTFTKELESLKQKYISACEERALTPELIESAFDEQKSCNVITSIRLGEKQYNKRVEEETTPKTVQELIFFTAKSITTYIYKLHTYGEDSERAYNTVLELLDALNIKKITNDDLKSLLYNAAEEEFAIIKQLSDIQKQLYGTPDEAIVSFSTSPNKAILVEGTNIKELVNILDAAKNMGIDIYTHGEMLAAHTYPAIRAYEELKGHYGKGSGNTLLDFSTFPGAIFIGRHSIDNIESLYRGRLFTTDIVVPQGVLKIENSNYEPLIAAALDSKGFKRGKKYDSEIVGFNLQTVKAEIELLNGENISGICFITHDNETIEDKNYFDKFIKLLPDDIFVINFANSYERKNIINIKHCYSIYAIFEILTIIKEKFDISEIPITAFVPRCDKHITNLILNLLHFGVKKIFMGKCAAKNLNPAVAEEFCKIFDITPYNTPKEDYKKFIDVLSL